MWEWFEGNWEIITAFSTAASAMCIAVTTAIAYCSSRSTAKAASAARKSAKVAEEQHLAFLAAQDTKISFDSLQYRPEKEVMVLKGRCVAGPPTTVVFAKAVFKARATLAKSEQEHVPCSFGDKLEFVFQVPHKEYDVYMLDSISLLMEDGTGYRVPLSHVKRLTNACVLGEAQQVDDNNRA